MVTEEQFIRQQIAEIHQSYQKQLEPWLHRLAQLEVYKPLQVLLTLEEAERLGLKVGK